MVDPRCHVTPGSGADYVPPYPVRQPKARSRNCLFERQRRQFRRCPPSNTTSQSGNASFDDFGALNARMGSLAVYVRQILTLAEMIQLDNKLPIR